MAWFILFLRMLLVLIFALYMAMHYDYDLGRHFLVSKPNSCIAYLRLLEMKWTLPTNMTNL
jgi:hypothetical protein